MNNIRAVKLPWGDILHTFMYSNKVCVFAKDLVDKLGLGWQQEAEAIDRNEALDVFFVNPQEVGLDTDDTAEYMVFDLPTLHGYLFSIDTSVFDQDAHKQHILTYQRECMKALDNYWRFGKAVNPAYYINERCKKMAETGELDFTPNKDIDKYQNFMVQFQRAATATCMNREGIKLAAESAEGAGLTGMNDLINFLKALTPVSPDAISIKNMIDRNLVAITESDFSGYIQDHLADYLANRLLEDSGNNFFRGVRVQNRSEGELEYRLLSTIEEWMTDFLAEMLGENVLAQIASNETHAA